MIGADGRSRWGTARRCLLGAATAAVVWLTALPVSVEASTSRSVPLLSATQLPGTWTAAKGPFTLEAGCLSRALLLASPGARQMARGDTALVTGEGDLPRVAERVVKTADSAAALRTEVNRLTACRSYSGGGEDSGVHGTVQRVRTMNGLPGVSFTASVTRNGISATEALVVARVGPFLVVVSTSDLRTNLPLFAQAARAALEDLHRAVATS